MGLRDTDHVAVGSFLRDLETKGFDATTRFSGYGGMSMNTVGGNGSWPWLSMRPPGAKYDYAREAGDLWRNTVAAICFAWIKKNFPEPRPCVRRKKAGGPPEEVPNHELIAILDEGPNPFYDSDTLWGATAVSYFSDGNAYWKKGQTVDGRTKQFWYVPHWQMFPRWDSAGMNFITHYDYIVDGVVIPLRPDQVVHFRNGLDPRNNRYGFTELGCAVREVCTDNEAASYTASTLRNMGIPGFILSPESEDATIEKTQREDMKKLWREEFTGEGRGGLLVNSVRVKMDKVSLTPEELVLDKLRQIPEARICAAIGLRPTVVGLSVGEKQRSYANGQEDRRAAYEDCIIPLQKSLGKQLSRQCRELIKPGECLGWDYSEVQALQEDATNRAKRAVILVQGQLAQQNEGRAMVGLPPVPGGDQFITTSNVAGAAPMIGDNKVGVQE